MSTAVPMTAIRSLDPNGFYSSHDLQLAFDLDPRLLNDAINNGRLAAVKMTAGSTDYLNQYRMKGSAVTAWMAEGCPTTRVATVQSSSRAATMATMRSAVAPLQPVATAPAQPAAPTRAPRPQADMDRAVMANFDDTVNKLAATGMSRTEAVKMVKQRAPNIYASAMATANAHRTAEARTATPRDAFEKLVQQKMATGLTRVQAAKAVAAESAA